MKFRTIYLSAFALMLIPMHNVKAWEYKPLEQECLDLSKETGKDYKVVSGEVIKAYAIEKHGGRDCFDCPPNSFESRMRAIMLPLNETNEDKQFFVLFPFENAMELSKKDRYMNIGSRYEFCAHGPYKNSSGARGTSYFIDNIETIHEITPKPALSELCAKLSDIDKQDYQIISGIVVESGITDQTTNGWRTYPMIFEGVINNESTTFGVISEPYYFSYLQRKLAPIEIGKKYQLCASGPYEEDSKSYQYYYSFKHIHTFEEILE